METPPEELRAASEVATNRHGCTLPLVHTTVDAELVTGHGGHRVLVSVDDIRVESPPIEDFAFYAGLSVLVGIGLVDLPVAAAIGVGHVLMGLTNRPRLQAFGTLLEEA